jgi:polysaccharide export outer membrane protein
MRTLTSSAVIKTLAPIERSRRSFSVLVLSALICILLAACSSISPRETTVKKNGQSDFQTDMPAKAQEFATPDRIKSLDTGEPFEYRFGPGDRISIQVWRRPELTQEGIVVSPDGLITVPRIGTLYVLGKSVIQVQHLVTQKLETFYIKPEVTVRVLDFQNNKAFVLGRVSKPGVVNFPGKGTLLEALALAGGIPDQNRVTSLTKCAIIRGNDIIIWIDLQDLLRNGNMALNAPVRNNDVIYIPEAADELVYVLGEVASPGAIQIKSGMNVLKAIMLAGGINKNADPEKVFVIRQQTVKGDVIRVNLKKLLETGDFAQNFSLMPNDIIYVSTGGLSSLNYTIEKILPSMQILNLGLGQSSFIYGTPTK